MISFISQIKTHILIVLFLFLYLLYSFSSYTKFGITWDEPNAYDSGKQLFQHLFVPKHSENQNLILRSSFNVTGPTYNHSYAAFLFGLNNNQQYDVYHLQNLLFATAIFIASYFLLYYKYKNAFLSLLGPLFIALNPRFFGDIAANPKDMPFAVLYFVSIVIFYFIPSLKNILLRVLILGVIFAFTQSSRIIGYTLYLVLFLYDLYRWHFRLRDFSKHHSSFLSFIYQELLYIGTIFICSNFIMVTTWPYVGSSYFKNFVNVLITSKNFPWLGTTFFMGKNYLYSNMPLSYLPIWLFISQPIFILMLVIGSFAIFSKYLKKNELLFLCVLPIIINLLFYFIVKPNIYDGLRHYLFILPIFSILAAICMIELLNSKINLLKYVLVVFIIINCFTVLASQIRLFPYQYIYFNELVGGLRGANKYFETDYWNASFKEAIVWLKKNRIVKNKKYLVYPCSYTSGMKQYLAKNMEFVDDYGKADYAICLTRFQEYKKLQGKIIHTVTRDSVPLNYVIENKR